MYKPQGTLRNYKKKGPSLQNVKGKLSVVDWNQERKDGMKHDEMQNMHYCCYSYIPRVLKFQGN